MFDRMAALLMRMALLVCQAGPLGEGPVRRVEPQSAFEGRWRFAERLGDPLAGSRGWGLQPGDPSPLIVQGSTWREGIRNSSLYWEVERRPSPALPIFDRWICAEGGTSWMSLSHTVGSYRKEANEFRIAYDRKGGPPPPSVDPAPGRVVEVYRRVVEPEPASEFEGRWESLWGYTDDDQVPLKRRIVVADGIWSEETAGVRTFVRVERLAGDPWPRIVYTRLHPQGPAWREETRKGFYMLRGDELTLRFGDDKANAVSPGPGRIVEVYSRTRNTPAPVLVPGARVRKRDGG